MVNWRTSISGIIAVQKAILRAAGDLDATLAAVVSGALAIFDQAAGAIIEIRDGESLVYRSAAGSVAPYVGFRLPLVGSLSGQCLVSGEPFLCVDSETDDRVDRLACRRTDIRSMLVVALPGQRGNIGVLKIISPTPNAFGADDLARAQLLIAPAAFGLANAAQIEASRRFEATFDQAAVGMAHVDPTGKFLRVNDRFCEVAGRDRENLCAGGFQEITHPDDLDADLELLTALAAGEIDHYEMEKRYVRPDGSWVWINLTVSMVAQRDGTPDFFVAVIEDISPRKAAERLATRDPLTGLPNRRAMVEHLTAALDELPEASSGLAVAYLDLDRFKQLNDRLGHAVGDECLATVARLIQNAIRQSDMLYRIAGDEFLLMLRNVRHEDAVRTLSRVQEIVHEESARRDWRIGISVGLVVVPPGASIEVAELLDDADKRMYAAKKLAA